MTKLEPYSVCMGVFMTSVWLTTQVWGFVEVIGLVEDCIIQIGQGKNLHAKYLSLYL